MTDIYRNRRILIKMTNYCNLRCFSCVDKAFDQKTPHHTPRSEIDSFLMLMQKYDPGCAVILTGGEPSLHPDLAEIAGLIRKYGFTSIILTNCAKKFDPTLFDRIILDDHGTNTGAVNGMARRIEESNFEGEWIIKSSHYHYDIAEARRGNVTEGARCYRWMMPNLWRKVVYPCVNLCQVDDWDGDEACMTALIDAGWTVDNPDLPSVMRRWRETLPPIVFKKCVVGCWVGSKNMRWKSNRP